MTFVEKYPYACVRFLIIISWHAYFCNLYKKQECLFARYFGSINLLHLTKGSYCSRGFYFWRNEKFPFESQKIHIPNMSLSCDIYRWQVHKKAITKFCYKDNPLCLSVFSNCAYFIAGCMRSLAFFSLPYFPSSEPVLLTPFLQENRKIVFSRPFWLQRYVIYSRCLFLIYVLVQREL